MSARPSRSGNGYLGAMGVVFVGLHAGVYAWQGTPGQALWSCTVACLLVGLGGLLSNAAVVGVGFLWLVAGTPLWLLYLGLGGTLLGTSVLTHGGGLVLGLALVRRLGLPAGTWKRAAAAQMALVATSRLLTAPAHNVNLAFHPLEGWERVFPWHLASLAATFAVQVCVFAGAERALRRRWSSI